MDLTEGSPFEDNHWEWGWCSEVIEHIEPEKKKTFVDEAIRICENIVFTFQPQNSQKYFMTILAIQMSKLILRKSILIPIKSQIKRLKMVGLFL